MAGTSYVTADHGDQDRPVGATGPRPTVGRIVHYRSYGTPGGEYGPECRAAIVTAVRGPAVHPTTGHEVDAWVVDLAVINPTGMFFNQGCVQDEAGWSGGTWHWPERAEETR